MNINWKEYIQKKLLIRYRCNFCRRWFDEQDDCKIHIIEDHEIKVKIKKCEKCKDPFVEELEGQVICGRKQCLTPH